MLNITNGKETYVLEKWAESNNESNIEKWVNNLREGVPRKLCRGTPCTFMRTNYFVQERQYYILFY